MSKHSYPTAPGAASSTTWVSQLGIAPRTIVVDLTGKLPPGSRQIRVVTNLQIYWDQILMDNSGQSHTSKNAQLLQTELPLLKASLAFRGYPKQTDGATSGDLNYDYQKMSRTGPFVAQRGAYTRYGDVTPLLQHVDDEYVIFGTGEDIDLEFSSTAQPSLPSGLGFRDATSSTRTALSKNMDFYEALSLHRGRNALSCDEQLSLSNRPALSRRR